jgi:hypothetical protein
MTDPIITPAPVPPSIAGIVQPVFESGSPTVPAAGPITGSPIIPPPTIGDPEGFPVFPPVDPDTAPVPVPVGPLVGPAVGPAAAPPSIPGVQQPQFVPPGSATVPASLFPEFTTTPPSPPIVFANVFKVGAIPPPLPSTPGQNPPPIIPSPVATIPQLPWPPIPPHPLPVNTVRPVITGTPTVGQTLTSTTGTWTNATTYAREWNRNGSPIAGATGTTYVLAAADLGALITVDVTATGPGGEASMNSLPTGPVVNVPAPTNTAAPVVSGLLVEGDTLTRTTGTWTGSPTFTTIWQRDGTNIAGATAATYVTVAADVGMMIGCVVTGTNAGGFHDAPSNTVGPITATELDDPEPAAARAAPTRHKTKRKR